MKISSERVSESVIDMVRENHFYISENCILLRLAEIQRNKQKKNEKFEAWKKTFFTVGAWERNYKG